MRDVKKSLESLSPEKRALLELLRKEKRQQEQQKQVIRRRPDRNLYPLSQSQKSLWIADQVEPNSSLYNISSGLRLKGTLDIEALERALTEVLKRHESLRARFTSVEGKPVQTIGKVDKFELPKIDLRTLPAVKLNSRMIELVEEEIKRSFNLNLGPLVRGLLICLEEEEYVLILTTHHIASDAWSRVVFTRELISAYKSFSKGEPLILPMQELQYADYAHWQHEFLKSDKMAKNIKYWKQKMAYSPPLLELPTDFSRPPVQNNKGARHNFIVSREKVQLLKELGRTQGATLFMTLLATFQVLLLHYSGKKDIIVGTPVANRNRQEIESMIGFFVNTLAIRVDLSKGPTFNELLQQVKEVALEAFEHQDLPFEKLVEIVQPKRSQSYHPLFQVFFDMDNVPDISIELPDLNIASLDFDRSTSKFDLSLYAKEKEDGLYLTFEYSTNLFEAKTIERMGRHFQNLINSIIKSPNQEIGTFSLIDQEEQERLFRKWKGQSYEISDNIGIHHLFEDQVTKTPEGIAVSFGERKLTYRELNIEANRLANALQKRGVRPGEMIAICVEKSLEMAIGILAIWKSGAVHVPLDPYYPQSRLEMMIEETMPSILLTQQHLYDRFSNFSTEVLKLDEYPSFYKNEEVTIPELEVKGGQPAYITFTSGSTGRPKGVMATHQGPVNYLNFIKKNYHLESSDIVLQLASFSFDASIRDLIGPLTAGAQVVILPHQDILDTNKLLKIIQEKKITRVLSMVPTHLNNLIQVASEIKWKNNSLKTILLSGEVLYSALASKASEVFPSASIVNQYGPTECTMTSSYYPIQDVQSSLGTVPIGRPIFNTNYYLLNSHMQPVPMGVPGELYIGGKGVSSGYYNQEELTNEKFVENPLSKNEKLFRTGDIVRLRSDGNFEFLGRHDSQVKLRGIRIELGEIESTLLEHESIENAVVILAEGQDGDKQLIAFYVKDSENYNISDLRLFLKDRLPEYMVPGIFTELKNFPLNPNGKIDRKALHSTDYLIQKLESKYIAPETEMEEKLASIWADVLNVENVGIMDNFFEIGGHSLLASQLIARVRQEFNVDIPLRILFDYSDIRNMARIIEEIRISDDQETLITQKLPIITPDLENVDKPFPMTDIQQAYWVGRNDSYELGNIATHSYMELEVINLDLNRLNNALNKLIERHGMLRAVLTPEGEQRILKEVPYYKIQVLNLHGLQGSIVEKRLEEIREKLSHQVLKLEQWPMFDIRATILDNNKTMLHISTDSFVSDAWSRRIMGRELFYIYQNPSAVLKPLELSFRDYVLAEQDIRNSKFYERAKAYWIQRLPDLPLAPELPIKVAPESLIKPHFVRRSACLEPSVWQRLRTKAAKAGLTPSGFILAAYAAVLGKWSKTQRFSINLTLFNRLPLHEQVNEIVGDFTSSILFAVDNEPGSFEYQARKIQQQLFNDIDYSAFSGVQVLRELNRRESGKGGMRAAMPIVLTSTLIDYQNGESNETFPSLWKENMDVGISQTPQVYLDHAVSERDGALLFRWDVVEEIFPDGMIQDMFDTYCSFLYQLADNDDAWHNISPELLPQYQKGLQDENNNTEGLVSNELLQTRFGEQVALRPQQVAIVSESHTLTYEELFRLSNQLGWKLREQGAKSNSLIAIVMEKGWEQAVAALGILQAGGAYLPIDPTLPKERLQYLLENGDVTIALTQTKWKDAIPWPSNIQISTVEDNDLSSYGETALEPVQSPEDLAYVIFTSGSTGEPKGVMIDHRGAVNTILDMNERFHVKPEDKVLAISALNFDLSVYDLFGMLAAGGTIVFPNAEGLRDPSHWSEVMKREGITVWNSAPALMEMLVDYADGKGEVLPESLRLALLSGDWIPVSLPTRLKDLVPDVKVISLGGATEASIWSILYPIEEVNLKWKSIPYGKPMRNQRFYVLNEKLEPCPTWVPGQLYIGGIGLAKGYWKDEAKTNASFIVHPVTGERLYKTGDTGCYLPDGNIEFMGREDFQVKIQGYRIELGEIESVLSQHNAVRNAVVQAVGSRSGNKKLVGYLVLEYPVDELTSEFQSYLHGRIPAYMIPMKFVSINEVPLSENGKVNRKLLPEPQFDSKGREVEGEVTQTEKKLIEVWKIALNLRNVDRMDNFFNVGGDSVIAIKLLARVNKLFGLKLSPRLLFENPSIAHLARKIDEIRSNKKVKDQIENVHLEKVSRKEKLPLSFGQQRLWDICKMDPNNSQYNIPVVIRLNGKLDLKSFRKALNKIIARHEILRTGFKSRLGKAELYITNELPLHMPLVDLSELPETKRIEEAMKLAEEEVRVPFVMEEPGLIRFKMLHIGKDDHIFVMTIHHIISDAWSIEVFLKDMLTFYRGFVEGNSPKYPELEIQYADFAKWQHEWLEGDEASRQLNYWKKQLSGTLELLNLPISQERKRNNHFIGGRKIVQLSQENSEKFHSIFKSEGSTLFMAILSVFNIWLYRYTKQEDFIVSTSISNRKGEAEGELIGFFLNNLALRNDISGDPNFYQLLARVKEVALSAYANQDIPFERVAEQVNINRKEVQSPLTQVVFGLRNHPLRSLEMSGLQMQQLDVYRGSAKFELEMQLVNTSEGRIQGYLEYNAELFEEKRIEEMVEEFHKIANMVADNPNLKVKAIVNSLVEEEANRRKSERKQKEEEKRKKLLGKKQRKIQFTTN
ncbi:amino acid adenylation domain-containing protein [Cytobacillus pseudoceanisediminis]|uniref:Amino acid adenylation domain-containing protein n=1 Tax=Cytobacillus pseudoceanisediminis TaxID=3051614 RepID=A0ABZ2ZPA1_9BACI